MKHTSKILAVLCIAVILVAALITSVAALGTGDVTTGSATKFYEYSSVKQLMWDSIDNGDSSSNADAKKGKATGTPVTIVSDNKGAPYIYAEAGTTSSAGYVVVDHSKIGNINAAANDRTLYIQPAYAKISDVKTNADKTPVNGFVLEFDIGAVGGTSYASSTSPAPIQLFNDISATVGFLDLGYFYVSGGVMKVMNAAKTKTVSSGTNGWVHISVVYTPPANGGTLSGQITMYANPADKSDPKGDAGVTRTFMQQISATSSGKEVYPLQIRMGSQRLTSGKYGVDNFLFYQGTSVCNPKYLESLTPVDVFREYVGVITDTTAPAETRFSTYETLRDDYVPLYWQGGNYIGDAVSNTQLQSLVEQYVAFERDSAADVKVQAMANNTKTFKSLVDAFKAQGRGISNITARKEAMNKINTFLADIGSMIDRTDKDSYQASEAAFEEYSQYITDDECVSLFKFHMDKFALARDKLGMILGAPAMEKHFGIAAENVAYVEALAKPASGTNPLRTIYNATDLTAVDSAMVAYETARDTTLPTVLKTAKTQEFVDLATLLAGTTETDWENDDGTIRNQWYLARKIYEAEDTYLVNADFTEAEKIYKPVDAYFWAKTQEEHIAVLNAKLAVFNDESSDYIIRASACTYIDKYIERNAENGDIDLTNETIINIQNENAANRLKLVDLEFDYSTLLAQNTETFKALMAELEEMTTYAEMKPALEAAEEYYYSMNISDDEAVHAVEVYETVRAKLILIEVDSALFVSQMNSINAAKKIPDIFYEKLLTCYGCQENLDVTYPGVSKHKDNYDALIAEYIASTTLANNESAAAVGSIGSVRVGFGVDELTKFTIEALK